MYEFFYEKLALVSRRSTAYSFTFKAAVFSVDDESVLIANDYASSTAPAFQDGWVRRNREH